MSSMDLSEFVTAIILFGIIVIVLVKCDNAPCHGAKEDLMTYDQCVLQNYNMTNVEIYCKSFIRNQEQPKPEWKAND